MFKVSEKVDSGPIIIRNSFNVKRTDLYPELRKKQAISIIKMIRNFLDLYPNLKYKDQFKVINLIKNFFKKNNK